MTWRLAFLLVALVIAALLIVAQVGSGLRRQDPTYLWGRYEATRHAFLVSIATTDRNEQGRLATENQQWFDELKRRALVLPITRPAPDDPDQDDFLRATSGIRFIRPGWSMIGGRWPVGREYVDAHDIEAIPARFRAGESP